eukprot:15890035-Heterocapsa_arctica.AAC.2
MLEAMVSELQKEKDNIYGETNMFVQEIRGDNLNNNIKQHQQDMRREHELAKDIFIIFIKKRRRARTL